MLSFKEKEEDFKKAADAVKKSKENLKKAESDLENEKIKTFIGLQTDEWKEEKKRIIDNLDLLISNAEKDMDTKEILMREAYDKVIEVGGDLPQLNVPKSTINLLGGQKQELLIFYQDLAKATKTLQNKKEFLAKILAEIKENKKTFAKTKESELIYEIKIKRATIAVDEAVIEKNKAVRELIKEIREQEIVAKSDLRKAIDTVAEKQAIIQKKQKEIDEQKTDYNNILNQLKIHGNKNIATLKENLSKIIIDVDSLSVELSIAQVELEEAKQEVDKFTKKK